MTKREHRAERAEYDRRVSGFALHHVLWAIVVVVIGIFLVYKILPSSQQRQTAPKEGKGEARQTEEAKRPISRETHAQRQNQTPAPTETTGSFERSRRDFQRGRPTTRYLPRNQQPVLTYSEVQHLINTLLQMKPRDGKFSPEEIGEINRLIDDLKRQGLAGSMAIREFLDSGQDMSFAQYAGKIPPEYGSLRLALIDALAQMGVPETNAYLAGMLRTTTNPEEIALVAKGLEQSAPGAYRADIMNVVRTLLAQALKATPGQYQGLGHLFGVIQDYGDATIAADLENMYRKAPSAFTELALMALSKLPEGYGIPTLLKILNEMSASPGTYGMTYDMALRYLTQASREYKDATDALLKLAASNKIATSGYVQVANALGGIEHEIITKSSDIARISRAETKINVSAAATWSDAEINQRLGLIDTLLRNNLQPPAVKALQDARNRLLVWQARPMVGGKRVAR